MMEAWILEGLTSGAATPLELSKRVWARHRNEIETSDLLYVWQVELHAAAGQMIAAGTVRPEGDRWTLTRPDDAASSVPPGRWSDDEIAVAAREYVAMLRDHHDGRPLRRRESTGRVSQGTGRSSAAVEAVFSNMSAVVLELGLEFLSAYPPKSNIAPGVRPAVRAALDHTP